MTIKWRMEIRQKNPVMEKQVIGIVFNRIREYGEPRGCKSSLETGGGDLPHHRLRGE